MQTQKIEAAGFIVEPVDGCVIYGAGETEDAAWAKVVDAVGTFFGPEGTRISEDEARKTLFIFVPATAALIAEVDQRGGLVDWTRMNGIAHVRAAGSPHISGHQADGALNMTDFCQHTPWGEPEVFEARGDGILFVATASHGGFHLTPEALALVPEAWRLARHKGHDTLSCPWFEQDVDWVLVALTFPDSFPAVALAAAAPVFDAFFTKKGLSRNEGHIAPALTAPSRHPATNIGA